MRKTISFMFFILFFLSQKSSVLNDSSYVVCYSLNEKSALEWDWATVIDENKQRYFKIYGTWGRDGTFTAPTNSPEEITQVCKDTIKRTHSDKNKFYYFGASNYFYSDNHHIRFPDLQRNFKIQKIVLFGDSLSDTGNIFRKSIRMLPTIPYWNGRFTNGAVWSERLANQLHIPLENYAYGGAKTAADFDPSWYSLFYHYMSSPMTKNVEQYLYDKSSSIYNKNNDFDEKLFVIWIGGNNYISLVDYKEEEVVNAIADIQQAISRLIKAGARYFLIPSLPPIHLTPYVINHVDKNLQIVMKRYTEKHNELLKKMIAGMSKVFSEKKIKLIPFDTIGFMNKLSIKKENIGFTNTTDACYTGTYTNLNTTIFDGYQQLICQKPNEYVYFDQIHPTTKTHCLFAQEISNVLSRQGLIDLQKTNLLDSDKINLCLSSDFINN